MASKKKRPTKRRQSLILGWKVTASMDPRFWIENRSKRRNLSLDDLVLVDSDSIDKHTAIIAQSGSGKSFFLGRLIEEIIVNTKARCSIIDPNSDFKEIYKIENEILWNSAKYDIVKGVGKLPHETSREEFTQNWPQDSIRVIGGDYRSEKPPTCQMMKLDWLSLSIDFMADELDAIYQSDLRLCHAFVCDVICLLRRNLKKNTKEDLIQVARTLFEKSSGLSREGYKSLIDEYASASIMDDLLAFDELAGKPGTLIIEFMDINISFDLTKIPGGRDGLEKILRNRADVLISKIVNEVQAIRKDIAHFYFSRFYEYSSCGIIEKSFVRSDSTINKNHRIRVLDLPSFWQKSNRLLAINAFLEEEWDIARENWEKALQKNPNLDDRVPTFIVIDEAHNLIPVATKDKASAVIKEHLCKIVAEGRKYGLFLILVTQRPDKVDPLILSECENYAIMRLSNDRTIDITKKSLNLDAIPKQMLQKCLEFKTGRVLLAGKWVVSGGEIMYSAARRTVEGGRSLRADSWAYPY